MTQPPDFDALYAADPDPWQVGSSFYEERKRRIVAALPTRARLGAVWDPACGTGHLAAALAPRATSVLATDLADGAVTAARRTCAGLGNVTVARHTLPDPPPGTSPGTSRFDLVVLAEFLYYLDAPARRATLAMLTAHTADDAEVLAVHWRHHPADAYLSGAAMQEEIVASLVGAGWRRPVHLDDADFVADVLTRH